MNIQTIALLGASFFFAGEAIAAEKTPEIKPLPPEKALTLTRTKARVLQTYNEFLQLAEMYRQKETALKDQSADLKDAVQRAIAEAGADKANCTLNDDMQSFNCPIAKPEKPEKK